jgi:hypothetical protein
MERVTPEALALTLAVQDEVVQRADEAQRLRHLQVERAQYEANLAQRRYLKVDPDNRLVATILEAEWNTKLRELEEARAIEEQYNQSDQYQVSAEERAEIAGVPERFRQFWNSPKTTVRQRKHAVRLVIEDVTVSKTDHIVAHIRFKGGATQTITVALPPPFAQSRLTAPETLAEMDRLLEESTDAEVAEQLNQRGYRTFDGLLLETHPCLPTASTSPHSRSVHPLTGSRHVDRRGTGEELRCLRSSYLAKIPSGTHCWSAVQ